MNEQWVVCVKEIKNLPKYGVKGQVYKIIEGRLHRGPIWLKINGKHTYCTSSRFAYITPVHIPLDSLI